MIYTVTLNPALDYAVKVENVRLGEANRCAGEKMSFGGKGINVSAVLNNLGVANVALGFVAGFTGMEIERRVQELGVKTDFIHLENGCSRINVKVKAAEETELNCSGPEILPEELDQLLEQLKMLKDGDILVLAGSVPAGVSDDIYEQIMTLLARQNVLFVVDAAKDLLRNVLKYHPFLIKPNHHELAELFDVELKTDDDVIFYAKKLQEQGAKNVLISMAGDGAIFLSKDGGVQNIEAPKGTVVDSVGAGDSMVAGFLAGYLGTNDVAAALQMSIAAGSATAFSEGLATREAVEEVLGQMKSQGKCIT